MSPCLWASLPISRAFLPYFYSLLRPDGDYTYPAIIHDYLYWTQDRSREAADDIFKFGMEDFAISKVKIVAIYEAVRLAGRPCLVRQRRAEGRRREARSGKIPTRPAHNVGGVESPRRRVSVTSGSTLYRACRTFLRLGVLLLTIVVAGVDDAVGQEHRIALSVGISAYDHLQPEFQLENPARDAEAIAGVFSRLDYSVDAENNLRSHEFDALFDSFLDKIRAGETTAVIFLSGHGIEIEGQTYLLPRDVPQAKYGQESRLRRLSVSIDELRGRVRERKPKRLILILDACRVHPLIPDQFRMAFPQVRTAGVTNKSGIAGEFLMYSAGSGQEALERLNAEDPVRHSVYVRHLLPLLQQRGLDIDDLNEILEDLVYASAQSVGHLQIPTDSDQMIGDFCFAGCVEPTPPRPSPTEPVKQYQPEGTAEAEIAALSPEPELDPPAPDPSAIEQALALTRDDWRRVQSSLDALGYEPRGVDGVPGANTRAAIGSWQRAKGTKVTGFLDENQYARLVAEAEPKLAALEAARSQPPRPEPVQPAVGVFREYQPGDYFKDCDDCPGMVVVPSGSFMMGSSDNEQGRDSDEGPRHLVKIDEPFAVGRFEVTFDEWDACVADGGCRGYEDEDWGRGKRPVINVSWEDAQAYVAWLSQATGEEYRLLAEAEWEYAARADTATRYWWGDEITPEYANYEESGYHRTTEVDSYPANPWGLYNMHGNVWEWVEDCWNDSYKGAPSDGRAWTTGDCGRRLVRGGSWFSDPKSLRSTPPQ